MAPRGLLTFLPPYTNRLDAKNFSTRLWKGPATCFPSPIRLATFVLSITTTRSMERLCITWDGVTDRRERRDCFTGFTDHQGSGMAGMDKKGSPGHRGEWRAGKGGHSWCLAQRERLLRHYCGGGILSRCLPC